MAYTLNLRSSVKHFLRDGSGLSRSGLIKILSQLHLLLGENGDLYRREPHRRLGQDSPVFILDLVMIDRDAAGGPRWRNFWFVVDDCAAEYGVLTVEYADSSEPPFSLLQ